MWMFVYAVPLYVTFTVNQWLMMMDPELTKMTPPEELSADMMKRPPEEVLPSKERPPKGIVAFI